MKILYPGLRVRVNPLYWEGRTDKLIIVWEGIITAGPGEFCGEGDSDDKPSYTWEVTMLDGRELVAETDALEPILPSNLLFAVEEKELKLIAK